MPAPTSDVLPGQWLRRVLTGDMALPVSNSNQIFLITFDLALDLDELDSSSIH